MSEKYYTVKQATEGIGISGQTITKAIRDKQLKASEIPAGGRRGYTYRIAETDLIEWMDNRKKRMTIIPEVTTMTVDDVANEILARIQKAYDDGFKAGVKHAKAEMLGAIKGVKL